jgi:hypothetical protein
VLAHGVDLVDRRAGFQQGLGSLLQVVQRHAVDGQRQQRRAPARDQAHHQVLLVGRLEQLGYGAGRLDPRLVRHGMVGFSNLDTPGGYAIAVADRYRPFDGHVGGDQALQLGGHRRRGLARADDQHPTQPAKLIRFIGNAERVTVQLQG